MSAKLTKAQREALAPLTAKRRAFVLAYVGEAMGNATEAARIAGYAKPGQEGHRLLKNADVQAAIATFRIPSERKAVATIERLQERWTEIAWSEGVATKDALKASELLGKSLGAFLDRQQVEHSGATAVHVVASPAEQRRLAKGPAKGERGDG